MRAPDRFATAAAISANTFDPGVDVAYIANAYNFPDALAGAAAAGTIAGPVLLVAATGTINPSTATELTRLAPKNIIVLGSTGVVSAGVITDLAGYTAGTVERYWGPDRFATAAAISANTFGPGVDVAYIANAFNFPDALAGAAAAGTIKGPVLLVAATGAINPSTAPSSPGSQPKKIVVLGCTGVVSAAVMTASGYATAHRRPLCGPDRFATAAAISADTFGPVSMSPISPTPSTSPTPSPARRRRARSRVRCSWSPPRAPSTPLPRPSSPGSIRPRSSCSAPPAWSQPR